jgi:hemerythrin-like domain-containing protein
MTPTEELILEHNTLKEMLEIMKKIAENIDTDRGFDTSDVEKIIDFLRVFADNCHHGKEEKVLFPALVLEGLAEEKGPISVMLQEHNIGRGYVNGMIAGLEDFKMNFAKSGRLIAACLTNYANLLQTHIRNEDNVLFPMADKVLSGQKQNEILKQFEKIEEDVIGHGAREQYHELIKQLKIKYMDCYAM